MAVPARVITMVTPVPVAKAGVARDVRIVPTRARHPGRSSVLMEGPATMSQGNFTVCEF